MGNTYEYGSEAVPAPQAVLMKTIVEAVLGEHLPWDLMAMGGALALSAALVGLPALSFALGVYLPLATLGTIFVGGCVRRWVERKPGSAVGAGILCASGFVAGEGLVGVFNVAWTAWKGVGPSVPAPGPIATAVALAVLLALGVVLARSTRRSPA